MYKPFDSATDVAQSEQQILQYWQQADIPKRSEQDNGNPPFVFFEGPPTANGKPGIHHMMARTLKDSVCRYKTMNGFVVKRKAGWDTHGLPVEIEVGKTLNLRNKEAIIDYGLEKFNTACKESVFTYEKLWRNMTATMGYWLDMDNPYITLDNNYIESVWWLLKQMFDKGLIYKGYKIVPYSPSSGTPLSSHEVAQGYKETVDPSVFVKFEHATEPNTYFLAWTTTPWTLISNVALVVNPEHDYVKVLHQEQNLILAKALLHVLDGDYEIVETFKGKELEYTPYKQLFPYVVPQQKAFYLACADYVSMDNGTGVVHTAPAFGADDYELGKQYDLPMLQPVDEAGRFTADITDYAGQFVKDADKAIMRNLRDRGLMYKQGQIKHTYPFDWRTDEPLIYYARASWYISTTKYRDQLIENNKTVNWYPPFVGEKRFGEWLDNNVDWALSRDRFWGTPLNIWVDDQTGEMISIGSIAELQKLGQMEDGSPVPDDIELHKPWIDRVVVKNPANGNVMRRTPEVIDCWFDSGAMPFAQRHYPFQNKENFDQMFPADFICEGIDQTRGWFYTLLAISTIITGKAPYKNVLVNDLVLDAKGVKMSKTRGNSVDPMQMMQKYGADAVRWYMLTVSAPWVPTRFDEKGVGEVLSKVFGTLKNVYSFFATYANIDEIDVAAWPQRPATDEIDRWVLSRLNEIIASVTELLEQYDLTRALRLLGKFIQDDVSNWYVRRSRRRFWSMELTEDKKDAYATLYQVLTTVCQLMAPFAPFISEDIYRRLTGNDSVHLQSWPKAQADLVDTQLNKAMQTVITIVGLGRSARNATRNKVRQPLAAIYLPQSLQPLVEGKENLIKEEINIKDILWFSDEDNLINYDIKPDFKALGPRLGKQMKAVAAALAGLDANDVVAQINQNSAYMLSLDGQEIELKATDLTIGFAQKSGYAFAGERDVTIALDTELTDELIAEGYARELINKIQNSRKDSGYEVMDRIKVSYFADDEIAEVINQHGSYIAAETLCDGFTRLSAGNGLPTWDINGKEVGYQLQKTT